MTPPNGPEMIELKAVNQRKCTPWVHKGGSIPKVSGDKDDTIEEDDILEEEEDFDDNNSDDESDFEADSVTCNSPRLRLLSVSTYYSDLDIYLDFVILILILKLIPILKLILI